MIKRYILNADYWVLVFSLLLVRFPVALGFRGSALIRFLFLLPFLIIIIKNLLYLAQHSIHKIYFNPWLFVLFILYVGVETIAFLRTATNIFFSSSAIMGNWLVWFLFAMFGLFVFAAVNNRNGLQRFREAIYYALILYVSVNALMSILGFHSPDVLYFSSFRSVILGSLGIAADRVLFLTAAGINSFGLVGGAALVASAVLFFSSSRKIDRIIGVIGIVSSLYVVLLTDSRGALLFSLVSIFLSLFPFGMFIPALRWVAALAPALPFTLVSALRLLPTQISQVLNRSSSSQGADATLSGRFIIWNAILNHFYDFRFLNLFGFGFRGQVASGISWEYSYLFSSWLDPEVAGAHNFVLQTLLDTGYIGALITICFITSLLFALGSHLKNSQDHTIKVLFFLLIYLIVVGTTDTVLTPEHQELFLVFMLIWAAAGSLPKRKENIPLQLQHDPVDQRGMLPGSRQTGSQS